MSEVPVYRLVLSVKPELLLPELHHCRVRPFLRSYAPKLSHKRGRQQYLLVLFVEAELLLPKLHHCRVRPFLRSFDRGNLPGLGFRV